MNYKLAALLHTVVATESRARPGNGWMLVNSVARARKVLDDVIIRAAVCLEQNSLSGYCHVSSRSIAITFWDALCSQHLEYGSNYGHVTSIYGDLHGPGQIWGWRIHRSIFDESMVDNAAWCSYILR